MKHAEEKVACPWCGTFEECAYWGKGGMTREERVAQIEWMLRNNPPAFKEVYLAYGQWITSYLERYDGQVLGKCKEAVPLMINDFPELTKVKGHVFCTWGKRGHWWCEDPTGEVVDPTQTQFPRIFHYEPWKPGTPVCIGYCMCCGAEIWEPVESLDEAIRQDVCSRECLEDLAASIGDVFWPGEESNDSSS